MSNVETDPRYPIGKYIPQPYSEQQLKDWLNDIRFLPGLIENAVSNLDEHQYNTHYRDGGWTIKQLVHHVADSHMNAYIRFRLGLTEDVPVIKTYDEKAWATLKDSETLPANISITLLHALHTRWVEMLKPLGKNEWEKTVFHPQLNKEITLWHLLGMYAWHGKHHTAHIMKARENNGWD